MIVQCIPEDYNYRRTSNTCRSWMVLKNSQMAGLKIHSNYAKNRRHNRHSVQLTFLLYVHECLEMPLDPLDKDCQYYQATSMVSPQIIQKKENFIVSCWTETLALSVGWFFQLMQGWSATRLSARHMLVPNLLQFLLWQKVRNVHGVCRNWQVRHLVQIIFVELLMVGIVEVVRASRFQFIIQCLIFFVHNVMSTWKMNMHITFMLQKCMALQS